MGYEIIGRATINNAVTTIREYDNGFFVVEINKKVKYSAKTLDDLKEILDEAKVNYKIT